MRSRWLVLGLLAGCVVGPETPADGDRLAPLRAFEDARRAEADFAALPPAERALGPDPVDLVALPGGDRFAGALGGVDAAVLVDAAGAELDRIPAPALPSAVTVDPAGVAWIGGRASLELRGYRDDGGRLTEVARLLTGEPGAISDVASGSGDRLYVADRHGGRVLAVDTVSGGRTEVAQCRGPHRVAATASRLVVSCLLDRRVLVVDPDAALPPVAIDHDAPLLAVGAVDTATGLVVAAAGLEDAPLDRSDGGFGNIDSFVFVYRVAGGSAERIAELNTSALDVVQPSDVDVSVAPDGGIAVSVVGTGGGQRATATWPAGGGEPEVATEPCPPGVTARAGALAANPLLDAWILLDSGAEVVAVPGADAVPAEVRLGEALYSTVAVAPFNDTTGARSRFTCQACHVDGYGDGRTHWTGRDDVYATTRSVRGLFNNRPHFSRALDRTMTDMVDNEFSVMNRHSGSSAWFTLRADELPWLDLVAAGDVDPVDARRALMAFLMVYTHAPNPVVGSRTQWTAAERRGAELFRDRCEVCHAARLSADDAASRVAFDDWERLVMSESGPIVWGNDAYQQTGVEPYVHPDGSRVPSLRRLARKHPYFTNGTAGDLPELLARIRSDASGALRHDGGSGARLSADEQAALLAFLRLL